MVEPAQLVAVPGRNNNNQLPFNGDAWQPRSRQFLADDGNNSEVTMNILSVDSLKEAVDTINHINEVRIDSMTTGVVQLHCGHKMLHISLKCDASPEGYKLYATSFFADHWLEIQPPQEGYPLYTCADPRHQAHANEEKEMHAKQMAREYFSAGMIQAASRLMSAIKDDNELSDAEVVLIDHIVDHLDYLLEEEIGR